MEKKVACLRLNANVSTPIHPVLISQHNILLCKVATQRAAIFEFWMKINFVKLIDRHKFEYE